jgi:hypothetical protein
MVAKASAKTRTVYMMAASSRHTAYPCFRHHHQRKPLQLSSNIAMEWVYIKRGKGHRKRVRIIVTIVTIIIIIIINQWQRIDIALRSKST